MRCSICEKYADFFIRDYESCYAVYHKNHVCICGHLHKIDEDSCIEQNCNCVNYQSQGDFEKKVFTN